MNRAILGILSLFSLALGGLLLFSARRRAEGNAPHCARCGYNLTGLPNPPACPECGTKLSADFIVRGPPTEFNLARILLGSFLVAIPAFAAIYYYYRTNR